MNFATGTIWTGDNLDILRGMNAGCVDLIYLDPPFNSNANYAAPVGSQAAGAAFKDTWGLDDLKEVWHLEIEEEYPGLYSLLLATREIHGDSMMSYLIYMAIRLMEMRRVLKETGSIYLHCDPTASHYIKLMMDAVFGKQAFRNEVVWKRDAAGKGGKRTSRQWPRLSDALLFYSHGDQWTFDQEFSALREEKKQAYRQIEPETGRRYKAVQLGNYSHASIARMQEQGLIHTSGTGKQYKKYYLDEARETVGNVWTDILGFGVQTNAKERTGYPTQKPLALLRRIIQASSNPGDLVLDPFCGCATACIAAEELGRRWVGIDISPKAADLVQSRLHAELGLFWSGQHRTDVPKRTDLGRIPPYNCKENRTYLYGLQEGNCNGCGEHFQLRNLTIDHIIPRSKGGTDHIGNLQFLCQACNSMKGPRTNEYLLAVLTKRGLRRRRATLERR